MEGDFIWPRVLRSHANMAAACSDLTRAARQVSPHPLPHSSPTLLYAPRSGAFSFAYFLATQKKSKLPPGNPRLVGKLAHLEQRE
jgi:hypothetical protein